MTTPPLSSTTPAAADCSLADSKVLPLMKRIKRIESSWSPPPPPLSVEIAMSSIDIVQEILSWLPAQSVIRFKSVCKQWRDITSTPYFVSDYLRRNPKAGLFLTFWPLPPTYKYAYDSCSLDGRGSRVFPKPCRLVKAGKTLRSCNGLILGKSTTAKTNKFWVYNPTTRQHRVLPELKSKNRITAFAFDPWRSTRYSVLLLSPSTSPLKITVYRSETGSWHRTVVGGDQEALSLLRFNLGKAQKCFHNGFVHWLTEDGFLISLDVERCSVQVTAACVPMHGNYEVLHFGPPTTQGNRLFLIRCDRAKKTAEVLEMATGGSRWLLLHSIVIEDVYQLARHFVRRRFKTSDIILGLSNCALVDGKVVMQLNDKIVAYHLTDKTISVLCTRTTCGDWRLCISTLVAP